MSKIKKSINQNDAQLLDGHVFCMHRPYYAQAHTSRMQVRIITNWGQSVNTRCVGVVYDWRAKAHVPYKWTLYTMEDELLRGARVAVASITESNESQIIGRLCVSNDAIKRLFRLP